MVEETVLEETRALPRCVTLSMSFNLLGLCLSKYDTMIGWGERGGEDSKLDMC